MTPFLGRPPPPSDEATPRHDRLRHTLDNGADSARPPEMEPECLGVRLPRRKALTCGEGFLATGRVLHAFPMLLRVQRPSRRYTSLVIVETDDALGTRAADEVGGGRESHDQIQTFSSLAPKIFEPSQLGLV
jgi:hypothetical protein